MILSVQHITKSFGEETVLDDVSFYLEEQEKAALVGINGSGKSTLLKIIVGELEPDAGTITVAKEKKVGYLAQYQETFGDRTVYDEVMEAKRDLVEMEGRIRSIEEQLQDISEIEAESFMEKYHSLLHEFEARDGYSCASEVSGVLKGLGFSENDFSRRCSELSGGQKTRVALARLLAAHPDLLLLDEPTNHLDISSIRWLENFLLNYRGAVLVAAHDRYFLDRVVTKVVEISSHHASVYAGNYSCYAESAAKKREADQRAYFNQQREIHRQQEVIDKLRSFNREKSVKRAQSREKMLDKIDIIERPQDENSRMRIILTPSEESGKDVLFVEGLAKSFGEKHLFNGLSFDIRRGEHVALIGENGTGKTTILKILNGVLEADDGMFRIGTNVRIGYFDQEQQILHPQKTLFEEISDDHPEMTQTRIRNVLAAFLFTGDDVFTRIEDLSGGERVRMSLARLMLSEANFLMLDEPTNHLDIVSREILESAINSYEGTVLFVSHDRYFINRTASRILELDQGHITNYLGDYDYYLDKKEALSTIAVSSSEMKPVRDTRSSGRAEWEARKDEQSRDRKRKSRIIRIEEEITELENRLGELDDAFMDPSVSTDSASLAELHAEQTKIKRQVDTLYEEWESLEDHL